MTDSTAEPAPREAASGYDGGRHGTAGTDGTGETPLSAPAAHTAHPAGPGGAAPPPGAAAGARAARGAHRRGSRPRSRAAAVAPVAVWALTRAVLMLCVFKVVVVPGPDFTSDVSGIYYGWYDMLKAGIFPANDVTWQYPPAAALAILSPALLPFLDYPTAFYLLACAADAAVLVMLLRAARRPGGSRRGAWSWVAGVTLLGPTAYARYDLMVTAVAVGALLAGARHPRAAGALAAFGATLKVWPALLLVGVRRGRETRTVWTSALVTGAVVMCLFALAMPGSLAFLEFQQSRGTEVESLGALVFHVARQFGWEGQVLLNYGSMEFVGPYVNVVSDAALVLTLLAFLWLLLWRLRAARWTAATPADAALTAVLLFTTTSRVISPQYMIWLVGLAAVCLTLRTSRQALPAVLVLAATAVTLLEFPPGFAHVVASDWQGLLLMFVRNGLLVAASLLACVRLWRSARRTARSDGASGAQSPPDAEPGPEGTQEGAAQEEAALEGAAPQGAGQTAEPGVRSAPSVHTNATAR